MALGIATGSGVAAVVVEKTAETAVVAKNAEGIAASASLASKIGAVAEKAVKELPKTMLRSAEAEVVYKMAEEIDPSLAYTVKAAESIYNILSDSSVMSGVEKMASVATPEVAKDDAELSSIVQTTRYAKTTVSNINSKFDEVIHKAQEGIMDSANEVYEADAEKNRLNPNSSIDIDGRLYDTDDNGNIYKVSDVKDLPDEVGNSEEDDLLDEMGDKTDVGGKKQYYDDNGKLYRVDNELAANSEYSINGYDYKTDEQSRIISARGKIQTKNHEGRPPIEDSMENIGRGDQKKTDDRGHLIADRFNGGNGLENLIPMDSELNRKGGDYYKLEDYMADAVASGADVYAEINVVYDGDSARPSEFRIIVLVDGEKEIYVFKNEGGNSNDAG